MERMSPEKGAFQREISSSNQHFSVDVLVFGGVTLSIGCGLKHFLFLPRTLWRWSKLTCAHFSNGLEPPPTSYHIHFLPIPSLDRMWMRSCFPRGLGVRGLRHCHRLPSTTFTALDRSGDATTGGKTLVPWLDESVVIGLKASKSFPLFPKILLQGWGKC